MSPIAANLQAVRRRISEELQGDSRPVTIVAVAKAQPAEAIREAFAAGQRDFGENYVQEALAKMDALADLGATWHFIGGLQSNKARDVAERFDWVHSIDRERTADALSRHRPAGREPLNVCVQVNISREATKGGVTPGEVPALARHVAGLPGLRLRGLMGVANPSDASAARAEFASLAAVFRQLQAEGLDVDTLSMGMTQDFPAALAEGATMLRIGTAIFGPRVSKAEIAA
jgi:pyridoxal phosphate enzyme (YggS family)